MSILSRKKDWIALIVRNTEIPTSKGAIKKSREPKNIYANDTIERRAALWLEDHQDTVHLMHIKYDSANK